MTQPTEQPDEKPLQQTADPPEGIEYLQLARALADYCDARTRLQMASAMGVKAPKLLERLGTVMSIAERAATCWWGCAGGDHAIEHLLGSCVGTAHAGLRVGFMGYYDEAISLARHIAERANLLSLFTHDEAALTDWRSTDSETRRKSYSAVRVRTQIENIGSKVPTPEGHYRALSSYGAHPGRVPQLHNPQNRPNLGGFFEPTGFLISLNEIGRSIILATGLAAPLLKDTSVPTGRLVDSALSAAEHLGGVNVMEIGKLFTGKNTEQS